MKRKFLLLQTIQPTPLQLAVVRSLLNNLIYVEIDNNFIVSCNKSFKDTFSRELEKNQINFIVVYVNIKTGCDVFTQGINDSDREIIKAIVLDK